jgi:hypothetical protein
MMPMRFTTPISMSLSFLSAVVLSAAGCGGSSETVSVSGQVSYQGEPVPGGAITFFPAAGRPVIAAISDGGEYSAELRPHGEYVVVVNVGTDLPPGYQEGDPLPPPKIVLPPMYTTRVKSDLRAVVAEGSAQTIDFQLH